MTWARRSAIYLFSLLLLVSLVGGAGVYSVNAAFAKPDKLETWLDESGLYSSFTDTAADQALKAAGSQGSEAVALSNTDLNKAADQAFPKTLLKKSVNTFLDSNYDWLKGKTASPNFVVDLSTAKQSFADKAGEYAKNRVAALPVCTPSQLAEITDPSAIEPLIATCRPPGLDATAAGVKVSEQVANSDAFLSNPILTAQTVRPKENSVQGEPYYQKLSDLPKAYRAAQKLPFILVVLALVCILAMILLAPRRRSGVKRVGIVLLLAGALLIAGKVSSDFAFRQIEDRTFNPANNGKIQDSLVRFAHTVQHQITGTELYFAAAFLTLGVIVMIYLVTTKSDKAGSGPAGGDHTPVTHKPMENQASDIHLAPPRPHSPPKPPRLIQ